MRSLPVACLQIQDVWITIVFPDAEFALKSPEQQSQAHAALRQCARRAGLGGSIVTMWKDREGRKRFLSEPAQRPFFESVRYDQLFAQSNRTIDCADP